MLVCYSEHNSSRYMFSAMFTGGQDGGDSELYKPHVF